MKLYIIKMNKKEKKLDLLLVAPTGRKLLSPTCAGVIRFCYSVSPAGLLQMRPNNM